MKNLLLALAFPILLSADSANFDEIFGSSSSSSNSGVLKAESIDSSEAKNKIDSMSTPMTLIGALADSMKPPPGTYSSTGGSTPINANCYSIKNKALKAYCLNGESSCFDFGYYKREYGIPEWVEGFCKYNNSIPISLLDKYYRYGDVYSSFEEQFGRKAYESAKKYQYTSDQSMRKRWIIYYINGYMLK
jgi:hypothetical protein